MEKIDFNLLDESWIRVQLPDCSIQEVSITDALKNAHLYRDLGGEMPAQDIAILRLLIAIVFTVFTRVNLEGEEEPIEEEKQSNKRWKALWQNGCFPVKALEDYLDSQHERFWLFHPKRPFYQVPAAEKGTENSAAKLNGEVSESNNKARMFSLLGGSGKKAMSYPEAARWLLFMNNFDDCAAKQQDKSEGSRSTTVSWLGKLGIVMTIGNNLFENILLNMPMNQNADLEYYQAVPTWELETVRSKERETIAIPDNLASLFTVQSRRLFLKREDNQVIGYSVLGGDTFQEDAMIEPMTLWFNYEDKKEKTQSMRPLKHERSKQVWRNFSALVDTSDSLENRKCRPGVVSWYNEARKLMKSNAFVTFRTVCVRYDSSQSSSITDSFSDSLSFHADLLEEIGNEWRKQINEQISKIDDAAGKIGWLAILLARAAGQGEKEEKALAEIAKSQLYANVDLSFRDWLHQLDPSQKADERKTLQLGWEQKSRTIALSLGRQLVDEKGEVAFIGRKRTENDKKDHYYSAPKAFGIYQAGIWKIYPKYELKQEGVTKNG